MVLCEDCNDGKWSNEKESWKVPSANKKKGGKGVIELAECVFLLVRMKECVCVLVGGCKRRIPCMVRKG